MPVGAYGGKAEIMYQIAPDGPVYQPGTLSGNPLAMAAGIANLRLLRRDNFYKELNEKSEFFADGLTKAAEAAGVPVTLNRVGSLMTGFFTQDPVTDFESAMKSDADKYAVHYRQMLDKGVYLAPSQFEVAFISASHTTEELKKVIEMTEWSFKKIA